MTAMVYKLEDYNEITTAGFDYVLPTGVITLLQKLHRDLADIIPIQESVKSTHSSMMAGPSPIRKSRHYPNKKSSYHNNIVKDDSWEKPKFVVTKMEEKVGVEKSLNDLRICLNKISNKNYDIQRDTIFKHIDEIIETNNSADIETIARAIFDIASTNKFYSELYAMLFKELYNKHSLFKDTMELVFAQYLENISKIETIDPNVDYDKYCDNNKVNDKRKATSMFIINLMKQSILEKERIITIINHLLDLVMQYVDEPNRINEVDEITENIFIMVTSAMPDMKESFQSSGIINKISQCSQYNAKDRLSISSRAIFKYMDAVDVMKK